MNTDGMQADAEERVAPAGTGLVRAVGVVVVALSAVAQEYGSGINFVMPHSLETYPGAEGLVPLAMLVAGIVLIPQVVLFARYSIVMPRAGATYVWLTRGLGPYAGFAIAFLWFVGICGAIGFLAFATGTFLGDAAHASGFATQWFTTRTGHLVTGMAAIWLLTALHVSGVKNYGYLIYAAGVLVAVAAAIVIVAGFGADPARAVAKISTIAGIHATPRASHPSIGAFVSVIGLFMFAYGGLDASTSLAGEVADARRNMPRGIVAGWAIALVLYTLVSYALFHAVPWWSALPIVKSGHGYLLTTPALVGMLTPPTVDIFLNVLVAIVVVKTIAPQLLDASRFIFAWAQDGFVPEGLAGTNAAHAPAAAVILSAILGSIFLLDAVFGGWQIGVALRAISIALVFGGLGLATMLLAWWPRWRRMREFSLQCTHGAMVQVMAVCAVLIGVVLAASVIYTPGTAWYLQPWFQLTMATLLSLALAFRAHRRATSRHDDFCARFRTPPPQ
ncbi:MAG TPA: APC family permease [Steroidobacteraceae bacterium]|nr:APC family permease [Steroidobacteraceae bacterium]